jgi:thiol-disulfide isomerase/thioredoxin
VKGEKRMKRILMSFVVIGVLSLILTHITSAANAPPVKGGVLPVINLPIPKSLEEKDYLGLSGDGLFKIPQIKAKVVITEIFSMYCPYCQKDAPRINELYQMIENNPDLKTKIKLIGFGAGNSSYEVSVFKKTYAIPFPLFPDKDFVIHKAYGEVRTPYFIAVKINEDGTHQVIHSQLGDFQGPAPFLELILKASGLK